MNRNRLITLLWILLLFNVLLLVVFFILTNGDIGIFRFYDPDNQHVKFEQVNPKYDEWKRIRDRFCAYSELTQNEQYMNTFAKRKTTPIVRMINCTKPMKKKRVLIYTHVNVPKRIDEAMETWMFVNEENKASGLYEYLNIEIDVIGWGSEKNHAIVEKICQFPMTEMVEKLGCILRYLEDEKSEYDLYLRLDDDTYLFITEYAYLLSTIPLSDLTGQQTFVMGWVWKGFHLFGGASILFNQASLSLWNNFNKTNALSKCGLCIWDDYLMGYMLQSSGKSSETFHEYLGIWWENPIGWVVDRAAPHGQHMILADLVDSFHHQFPEPLTFHYSYEPEKLAYCSHRHYHGIQPIDNDGGVVVIENFYREEVIQSEKYQKWKEECVRDSEEMNLKLNFINYDYSTYYDLARQKNIRYKVYHNAQRHEYVEKGVVGVTNSFDFFRSSPHPFEAEHAKMIHYMLYLGGWILHYSPHTSESCRNRLQEIQEAMESVDGSEFVYKLVDDDDLSSRISFIGGTRCNLSAFWLLAEIIMNLEQGKPNIPFATAVLDLKKPLQFQKRIRKL